MVQNLNVIETDINKILKKKLQYNKVVNVSKLNAFTYAISTAIK